MKYFFSYPNKSFFEAQCQYIDEIIKPDLAKYDEKKYYKYPKTLRKLIDAKEI